MNNEKVARDLYKVYCSVKNLKGYNDRPVEEFDRILKELKVIINYIKDEVKPKKKKDKITVEQAGDILQKLFGGY